MTRKQLAVIATRIYEELNNIKSLVGELSERGLTGSKKKYPVGLTTGGYLPPAGRWFNIA